LGTNPDVATPYSKKEDADAMVSYIMSLDAAKEREQAASKLMPRPAYKIILKAEKPNQSAKTEKQGIAINVSICQCNWRSP
jgi:cytochrome c